jgi:hypothetical protein
MHVCATDSFTEGVGCATDQTICSVTGVASGANAQCNDGDVSNETGVLVPVPTAHTTGESVYIFLEDNHDFKDIGIGPSYDYDVTDVDPYIDSPGSYSTSTPITLTAGDSTSYQYTVTVKDDNADTDLVTPITGVIYDTAVHTLSVGDCNPSDENECYTVSCALSGNSDGNDNEATATCNFSIWFNANASANWKGHVNPEDERGAITNEDDSNVITINALSAITATQSSIDYGTLAVGKTSATGVEVSMGNVGNQEIDVTLDGTSMSGSVGASSIAASQQKWHFTSDTFDWDDPESGAGPYILETSASSPGGPGDGCLNRNLLIRSDHSSTSNNESTWFKLRVPSPQTPGTYTGSNTISATASDQCTGTQY